MFQPAAGPGECCEDHSPRRLRTSSPGAVLSGGARTSGFEHGVGLRGRAPLEIASFAFGSEGLRGRAGGDVEPVQRDPPLWGSTAVPEGAECIPLLHSLPPPLPSKTTTRQGPAGYVAFMPRKVTPSTPDVSPWQLRGRCRGLVRRKSRNI
ncbi:hypothetical protein MRX96_012005 [Rhipicephalus microplus]